MISTALKKITYFNTGRFPYGEIDVSGNTLLTGTNGVGKTTTMQSMLFFYGATNQKQLGIDKREGKDIWIKYTYPHLNSYVFYQYSGVSGKVLLMTYSAGNSIAYRFIAIEGEIDLKAIVLEDGVPQGVDKVGAKMFEMGLNPSRQIIGPTQYRKILYGDIDPRKEKEMGEFASYSMMSSKGGNYDLIPDMQSSIFTDSSVKSGAIEKAIVSGYGTGSIVNMAQIRGQLQHATEQYEAILVYDKQKAMLATIFDYHTKYVRQKSRVINGILQLESNFVQWNTELPSVAKAHKEKSLQLDTLREANIQESASLNASRDSVKTEMDFAMSELARAKTLRNKYDEKEMIAKANEVEKISAYEIALRQQEKAYDDFLGSQQNLSETFDRHISKVNEGLIEQKGESLKRYLTENEALEYSFAEAEKIYNSEITKQEAEHIERTKSLREKIATASAERDELFKALKVLESSNPYSDHANELSKSLKALRREIEASKKESVSLLDKMNVNSQRRSNYAEQIEAVGVDVQRRFATERKSLDDTIRTQEDLLNADESTVLHFIRTQLPANESTLTTLLKDEILLNTSLSPSAGISIDSAYGLRLDIAALPESGYSQEVIADKITLIRKEIQRKKEAIEIDAEERLNTLRQAENILQKEYYQLKEKRDGIENDLSRDASRLLALEEEQSIAEELSLQRWSQSKLGAKNGFTQTEERLRSLQQNLSEADSELRNVVENKRNIFLAFSENNRYLRRALSEKPQSVDAEAEAAAAQRITEIELLRNKALLNGGVSPEQLEQMCKDVNKSKSVLQRAKSYTDNVAVWRNDKTFFDLIPHLQERSEAEKRRFVDVEAHNIETFKVMASKDAELEAEVGILREKESLLVRNIGQEKETRAESRLMKLFGEIAHNQHDDVKANNQNAHDLHYNILGELNSTEECVVKIDTHLKRFVALIGDERFVFFKNDYSSSQNIADSARHLREFVEGVGLATTKELIAKEIRQIQGNIAERYTGLKDEGSKIDSLVRRIDRSLKEAIINIPVLDDIGVQYRKSEHRILADLDAIAAIDIPYGDMLSLFVDKEQSRTSSTLILDRFKSLLKSIDEERADEITITDTFEVEFRVVENGRDIGWVRSRNIIGSAGTSIIIKTLTYISLLDAVLKMTRKGDEAVIHVILDEIGVLDQHNMREIIKFANSSGIVLLNAAPDAKVPDLYNAIYHYRLINGKSKITLGAIAR